MTGRIAVIGGADGLGAVVADGVSAAGFAPIVVDLVEPSYVVDHLWADMDTADVGETLAGMSSVMGAVLCPVGWQASPGLLARWVMGLREFVVPGGLLVGLVPVAGNMVDDVARAQSNEGQEIRDQIRGLEDDATVDIRTCVLTYGALFPSFEDCRGEIH